MCQPKNLSALRWSSILPNFAIGSTFVFAHPMCLLVFQSLSGVLQSTQAHVSTNGYLKRWQCSLVISNVVPRISGTIIWRQLVQHIPKRVRSTREGCGAMEQTNLSRQEGPPWRARVCGIWRPTCEGPVCSVAMATCKTSNWCNHSVNIG